MVSQKLVARGSTFGCPFSRLSIIDICCILDIWVSDVVCYHLAASIILIYKGSGKKSLTKSLRKNEVDNVIIQCLFNKIITII